MGMEAYLLHGPETSDSFLVKVPNVLVFDREYHVAVRVLFQQRLFRVRSLKLHITMMRTNAITWFPMSDIY